MPSSKKPEHSINKYSYRLGEQQIEIREYLMSEFKGTATRYSISRYYNKKNSEPESLSKLVFVIHSQNGYAKVLIESFDMGSAFIKKIAPNQTEEYKLKSHLANLTIKEIKSKCADYNHKPIIEIKYKTDNKLAWIQRFISKNWELVNSEPGANTILRIKTLQPEIELEDLDLRIIPVNNDTNLQKCFEVLEDSLVKPDPTNEIRLPNIPIQELFDDKPGAGFYDELLTLVSEVNENDSSLKLQNLFNGDTLINMR